jgi:rhodanese-related sulfurtransferase
MKTLTERSAMYATRLLLVLAGLFLFPAGGIPPAHAQARGVASLGEVGMRWSAIQAPKPVYPKAAVDKGMAGVAVASILAGIDGRAETVVVLEAPDPSFAAAVRDALVRWTFQPVAIMGSAYKSTARLTFYFRIENGAGQVLNPEEMPGARWPKKPDPQKTETQSAAAPILMGTPESLIRFINENELKQELSSLRPVILDIRERDAFRQGHLEGAVNIPFAELQVRASIELPQARPLVVDCSSGDTWCGNPGAIMSILTSRGFSKVSIYR